MTQKKKKKLIYLKIIYITHTNRLELAFAQINREIIFEHVKFYNRVDGVMYFTTYFISKYPGISEVYELL